MRGVGVWAVLLLVTSSSLWSLATASLEQGAALQELVASNWITKPLPSWKPGTDPCVANWESVVCDTAGNLITLNLSHSGLIGPIPLAMGKLTTLTALDMSNDKVCTTCGPWNKVKGDLSALATLVNLESLILTSNELSLDYFPTSIYKLVNLVTLKVDNTLIRGSFPYDLSTHSNLQILWLGNNSFSGPLLGGPLSKLVNLRELTIWGSLYYSVCPPELGKLVNLTYLNLNKCGLYGGLPPEYGQLTNLQKLLLYKNNFTGPIPDSWRSMVSLTDFEVHNNYLYGKLPTWLLQIPSLGIIRGTNNNFYGALPPVLNSTYAPGLQNLSMECNYLNGDRPVVAPNITASLNYNCFTGDTTSDSACIRPQNCALFILSTQNGLVCPACPANQHLVNSSTCICFQDAAKKRHTLGIGAVIGVVIGGAVIVVVTLLLLYLFLCRPKSKDSTRLLSHADFFTTGKEAGSLRCNSIQQWEVPSGVQRFSIFELLNATNGFDKDHEIGEGSFGKVFVGNFPDGRTVAIKRAAPVSSTSGAGDHQFRNEVLLLSRLHHKNLVRLEGFCDDGEYQILVYEFMKLGNLHHLLHESEHGKNAGKYIMLDWYKRLEIALHVAQGLDYLHSFADPPVIHRDVKPSNILLDENLVAKVADFGISKESPEIDTHVSTRPAGTAGYFDPQYFLRRQLTPASDVYSFGVVLLELITGRRAIDLTVTSDDSNLIEWTRLKREHTDGIESIVDQKLEGKYPQETYTTLVDLALMCASFQKKKRPTMKYVVSILEPLLQSAERPPQNYARQQWPTSKGSPSHLSGPHSRGSEDMEDTFRTIGSRKRAYSDNRECDALKGSSPWVDWISSDVAINDGNTI